MPTQLTLTYPDFIVCLTTLVGSMLLGLWLGVRKSTQRNSDGFFWPVASWLGPSLAHRCTPRTSARNTSSACLAIVTATA